jgi:hypothetical protein
LRPHPLPPAGINASGASPLRHLFLIYFSNEKYLLFHEYLDGRPSVWKVFPLDVLKNNDEIFFNR